MLTTEKKLSELQEKHFGISSLEKKTKKPLSTTFSHLCSKLDLCL